MLEPWVHCGPAVAVDSTILRARGGVWHQKHRAAGIVPHTSIDTEAHWTKSGWHGWVYGGKLHQVTTAAAVWIPLAAELTPASTADNEQALLQLVELPAEVRYVLGDQHYNAPDVRDACDAADRALVATWRGAYPHTDGGVEVRRVLHELRSRAIENLNEQFLRRAWTSANEGAGQHPALGAVLVDQLMLWYRHAHALDLRVGLKPFLKAA